MSRSTTPAATSFASPTIRRDHLAATASSRCESRRANARLAGATLLLLVVAGAAVACALPGCARNRPAAPRDDAAVAEPVLLTRDYVAEILRYLYRWHADETLLSSVSQYSDTELWARALHPGLDAGDDSRFCEVLFPRVKMRIVLKQADYLVEELGQRVRNESFKVHSVGKYDSPPAAQDAYTVFRFDRGELADYLFRTRNERAFPDEHLLERLRGAVRKAMGERPADVEEGRRWFTSRRS